MQYTEYTSHEKHFIRLITKFVLANLVLLRRNKLCKGEKEINMPEQGCSPQALATKALAEKPIAGTFMVATVAGGC